MSDAPRPYTLIAELTYRCPLRCAYCSNPVSLERYERELDTQDWLRVFGQAEELGVVQVNLSGGEPLLRDDLEALVGKAHELGLYSNLITSGMPLSPERLSRLKELGLCAVQLSFQDVDPGGAARVAGRDVHEHKLAVARWVREVELPLTVNVVLHRENLDRVPAIIELADGLGAERVELANTQYLGWALPNRDQLLPTREALACARRAADDARVRLRGHMEVLFVLPDYQADVPRACMDGWARRFIVVAPDGVALPCHQAATIPHLHFESVRERSLVELWRDSPGFSAFRGDTWMKEPCRSCDRRGIDFGGCRCQAFHLTGDAAEADPACALAPRHDLVVAARRLAVVATTPPVPLTYRRVPTGR